MGFHVQTSGQTSPTTANTTPIPLSKYPCSQRPDPPGDNHHRTFSLRAPRECAAEEAKVEENAHMRNSHTRNVYEVSD